MAKRRYNSLGRRILSLLEIGGPRKRTVLLGIAQSEARLKPVLKRLLATGLVIYQRDGKRGGRLIALNPKRNPA